MNLFKRAWWRLTGHLGKTAILVGLFTVISTLVLSGFLIRSAAARAADDAKKTVGAVATMRLDINALINSGKSPEPQGDRAGGIGPAGELRRGLVDKICASPVLKGCNYTMESVALPGGGAKMYIPVPPPNGKQSEGPDFLSVDGVRDQRLVAAFRNGDAKMVAGRGIGPKSGSDEVVVERRLAQENRWKVGDRIELKVGMTQPGRKKNEKEYGFRVVGIYTSGTVDTGRHIPAMLDPANRIYASPDGATVLFDKELGAGGGEVMQATFTLADPADMGRLKKDAKAAGADLGIFPITVNDKQYRQLVGPIDNTADFATVTVWLVALAGTVILALIVASSLRERRKELGILLAIGERKPRLLGQHLTEVAACAVLAIGIAAAGSQFLSRTAGDRLLAGEVSSARESAGKADPAADPSNTLVGPGGPVTVADDEPETEPVDTLDVRLGTADIAKVGATGLGIAALAVVVPGFRVLRLRPRDILTKGD
ncbi:ABC transporter permease [Streptomyces sp. NPDC020875]|uniref:ABC transporter permease n=1 Tax=Streptomyces sp. NPDC020875 TaxID=3154898 RepID=UPI003410D945